MYIPDLTDLRAPEHEALAWVIHGSREFVPQGPVLAVGWLGEEVPTSGEVPDAVIERLIDAHHHAKFSDGTMGCHECELCPEPPMVDGMGKIPDTPWRGQPTGVLMSTHGYHLVQDDQHTFAAPAMIPHYILAHGYRPPDAFLEAVLHGRILKHADFRRSPRPLFAPPPDLQATAADLQERLGYRLDAVFPADNPRRVLLSRDGVHLTLEADAPAVRPDEPVDPGIPVPSVERSAHDPWIRGRAGMQYRDLLPRRWGGHTIASLIRIADAGPVPDQVHFHRVHFQMIVCVAGWVRVVYEDQGDPFLLEPGDAVLQPPGIRHRVLEASAGTEVVEVSSPAEHETWMDHDLELPNRVGDPQRTWGGQRFVRHVAAAAEWTGDECGFHVSDPGITAASDNCTRVRFLRCEPGSTPDWTGPEWRLLVVMEGKGQLESGGHAYALRRGKGLVLPPGEPADLMEHREVLTLLEVELPS